MSKVQDLVVAKNIDRLTRQLAQLIDELKAMGWRVEPVDEQAAPMGEMVLAGVEKGN